MKITFDILDAEGQSIADLHGYDAGTDGALEDYVLEKFKEFGRASLVSRGDVLKLKELELERVDATDALKSSISF